MKRLISYTLLSLVIFFTNGVLAQPLATEQFDLSATPVNFSGSNAANISYARIGSYGACGEVKITQVNAFSNGYQTFNYDFASPVTITSASDAVIKIRMRTASAVPMRLCFRGDIGTGIKNLSCNWAGKETSYTGNINTWQELSFDYSTAGDLNVSGCSGTAMTFPATINGIAININSGTTTFANPIYIDYLSVGATSPSSGNASCKTDIATGTPTPPLFEEKFSTSDPAPKTFTGTEITSGNITASRTTASSGAVCGQMDLQNAAGNLSTNYSTINYDTVVTLTSATDAVIRVRAKVTNGTAVPVRACFRGKPGGSSVVNLSNVWAREEKSLPGSGSFTELVYVYSFSGDLNSSGGAGTALTFPCTIDGIALSFYSGSTAVSSTISIDYIAIGNTTDATCPNFTSATLNAQQLAQIAVYPNPAKDQLTIEIPNALSSWNAQLINSQGVAVRQLNMTDPSALLNLQGLEKGLYLLSLNAEGKTVKAQKVVIE